MKKIRYDLWKKDEYTFEGAFGFMPNLTAYLHEDGISRPCLLVVPGGAYCAVAPSEGEIVAEAFYERGYQTFVCTYTTNPVGSFPLKLQPLQDLARAVRFLRRRHSELKVLENQIAVCGFSAGGHLVGSLCVHWRDAADETEEYAGISCRPDAAILSYPVISSGKWAHRFSFENLLGKDASQESMDYMSLELHVDSGTPPLFLWHTAEDKEVPVENSFLMAKSLRDNHVRFALHVFAEGNHGLSLSNEAWETTNYAGSYTAEQIEKTLDAAKRGLVPEQQKAIRQLELLNQLNQGNPMFKLKAVREVAAWPELADQWLRAIWEIPEGSRESGE